MDERLLDEKYALHCIGSLLDDDDDSAGPMTPTPRGAASRPDASFMAVAVPSSTMQIAGQKRRAVNNPAVTLCEPKRAKPNCWPRSGGPSAPSQPRGNLFYHKWAMQATSWRPQSSSFDDQQVPLPTRYFSPAPARPRYFSPAPTRPSYASKVAGWVGATGAGRAASVTSEQRVPRSHSHRPRSGASWCGRPQVNVPSNASRPKQARSLAGKTMINGIDLSRLKFVKPAQQCFYWDHPRHRVNQPECTRWHPRSLCIYHPRCHLTAEVCGFGHPFCTKEGYCRCEPGKKSLQMHHRCRPASAADVQADEVELKKNEQ